MEKQLDEAKEKLSQKEQEIENMKQEVSLAWSFQGMLLQLTGSQCEAFFERRCYQRSSLIADTTGHG